MVSEHNTHFDASKFRAELESRHHDFGQLTGWMFRGLFMYIDEAKQSWPQGNGLDGDPSGTPGLTDLRLSMASNTARFAGGRTAEDLKDPMITHVVVGQDRSRLTNIRETLKWQASASGLFHPDI